MKPELLHFAGLPDPIPVTNDSCFGKAFAKTADECRKCVAPVIVDKRIRLSNEVCRELSYGRPVQDANLKRLSSAQVATRFTQGASLFEIWREILADSDPELHGTEARTILSRRLRYLYDKAPDLFPEATELPRTSELLEQLNTPTE